MPLYVTLLAALAAIIVVLRLHRPIGLAMLAGGLAVWLLHDPSFVQLGDAAIATLESSRTWELLFALYFVMCLEVQLRVSGTLAKMLSALSRFCSLKMTLALMPAFLGLLPSIGGARFSAPIVKGSADPLGLAPDRAAAINFWFRHVFEFASPIIPGMILGCSIAGINVGDLVFHLFWLSILAFVLGWIVLIRPIRPTAEQLAEHEARMKDVSGRWSDIVLAVAPVFASVVLMLVWNVSAAAAMGAVVVAMFGVLALLGRGVGIVRTVREAWDTKLMLNISAILFFISLLEATGVLGTLVESLQSSSLPFAVVVAAIALLVGILTGMSQGHVAIVMPIVAAVAPGSLLFAGIAMVFGVAGQMVTPTHVCLTLSVDYFKASFAKTLAPVLVAETALLVIFAAVTFWMNPDVLGLA